MCYVSIEFLLLHTAAASDKVCCNSWKLQFFYEISIEFVKVVRTILAMAMLNSVLCINGITFAAHCCSIVVSVLQIINMAIPLKKWKWNCIKRLITVTNGYLEEDALDPLIYANLCRDAQLNAGANRHRNQYRRTKQRLWCIQGGPRLKRYKLGQDIHGGKKSLWV